MKNLLDRIFPVVCDENHYTGIRIIERENYGINLYIQRRRKDQKLEYFRTSFGKSMFGWSTGGYTQLPYTRKQHVWLHMYFGKIIPSIEIGVGWGKAHKTHWRKILNVYFDGSPSEPECRAYIRFGKLWIETNTPKFIQKYLKNRRVKAIWKENLADPDGLRCHNCGSHKLVDGNGMAFEPIIFCHDCGTIVVEPEDITPYII